MPIKWSAVEVSEAMDKAEDQINKAIPYLEKARAIARKAKGINNLPQYIDQCLSRLIFEIDRAIGDGRLEPIGRPRAAIKSVREAIPQGAIKAERGESKYGNTVALF
jgi:hypothetical protein